jgi:hypothetical protein
VHWFKLACIFLSHPIILVGLDGEALTRNQREQCFGVIPQEEPLFLPSNQRDGD